MGTIRISGGIMVRVSRACLYLAQVLSSAGGWTAFFFASFPFATRENITTYLPLFVGSTHLSFRMTSRASHSLPGSELHFRVTPGASFVP